MRILDGEFADAAMAQQVAELRAHLDSTEDPEALAEMRWPAGILGFR